MHHNGLECHSKRFVCYFQGQGHSKGSYDQNMTVSTVSSELLILLLQNLVWWYIIVSQSVLWRNCIAVFKVKVTAKLQNVNDCLSRCLLNCQTLYYQTWYSSASAWAKLSLRNIDLLSSRSRSKWRIMSPKMILWYIFWIADPLATKIIWFDGT